MMPFATQTIFALLMVSFIYTSQKSKGTTVTLVLQIIAHILVWIYLIAYIYLMLQSTNVIVCLIVLVVFLLYIAAVAAGRKVQKSAQ